MRKQGWDVLLGKFIASRLDTPFQWGIHDCTLFAADCMEAITGTDPAATYRGTYDSAATAGRIIADGGGLRAIVTATLGPEISISRARRGDLVMIEQDGSNAMAVCIGASLVAAGAAGLVYRPISAAITAWRVD